MLKYILGFLAITCSFFSHSQTIPMGSWIDHLAYTNANSAAYLNGQVFCSTESGVYSYNIHDNSISRYNTINVLSDVASQKIALNPFNNALCVFYMDGNIDIIKAGNTSNIPYLKNSHAIVNKNIKHVSFNKEYAYISYDFGLVKINTAKAEISETYDFSPINNQLDVNASQIYNESVYVATSNGIYKGSLQSNLLDFNNWSLETSAVQDTFGNIFTISNKLYAIRSGKNGELYQKTPTAWIKKQVNFTKLKFAKSFGKQLALVYQDKISIVDTSFTTELSFTGSYTNIVDIVKINENHHFLVNRNSGLWEHNTGHYIQSIKPNGPSSKDAFDMAAKDQNLWVIRGGMSGYWANVFNYGGLHYFDGSKWHNYDPYSNILYQKAYDMVDIIPHPTEEGKIYICSWGGGLLEMENNIPKILYNDSNSSIVSRSEFEYFGIGGGDFDQEGNLWISNAYNPIGLSVKKAEGGWKSFDLTGYMDFYTSTGDVVISPSGHKWILIPRHNQIVIYDDNKTIDNTSDDRVLKLTSSANNGNIPGASGIVVAMDKNGDAWAGSNSGIFVFYNAANIFENYKTGAQRIIIDAGENNEILLETISVNEIKIDGANRKWIATDGSGVYLISEDGKKQIHHFTMENSPLFSNVVNSLAIDHETGMVYMGTDKGIIAYRSDATIGKENFSEVKIFPNPVQPNYNGPITISGLMDNSLVKITDISGTLINELKSRGGQAVWNGTDFNGNRASTGVYLLFNSAMDADNQLQTEVAKILFVK